MRPRILSLVVLLIPCCVSKPVTPNVTDVSNGPDQHVVIVTYPPQRGILDQAIDFALLHLDSGLTYLREKL